METFLIVKLCGVMQAWGGHTYEDYRPCELFPTRSGLVGLLAACLGLRRQDSADQRRLAEGLRFAVRADAQAGPDGTPLSSRKITDFHTVENARRVDGKPGKFPVVSRREYLCDARFTVALGFQPRAAFGFDRIRQALGRPKFTPYLGRRSCPIGRPLLAGVVEADSIVGALAAVEPGGGTVYSEEPMPGAAPIRVRDVPTFGRNRQFLTRTVFVRHEENTHVSD